MPATFQLTPRALNDLDDIWEYIAEDSISAANPVESAILTACYSLARHPMLGSRRREITPLPVRFWAVTRYPNFIVVYRPETKPLQVVAIVHGKRNIPALLDERDTF
ncbi:MAG: type II toxin-antitoxin system RelE/ParE family toxin [Terracidiphilus sp.]|jgi:plasmid stabilization system protein ParE